MHRHGWWQALLVLACVLLIALLSGGQGSFLQILLVVPAYLIGRRWASMQPVLLGFGLGVVGQLVIWFLGEPADYLSQWFTSVLSDFVFLLLPWWLGRTLQQRETRRRQEAAVIADLARARERTRIAEDMHDLIGHDLALIAVHSGALEVLPGASEEQRQAAADIRSRAVSATDRLHECLGILRAEDPVDRRAPVGLDLEPVVSAARDAGVSVDVEVTGEVPSEVAAPAVERIVQEALTNAMKHASGAPVTIRVSADRETVEVSVDNPRPKTAPASTGQPREAAPANSGSGMGLIAAEERVRLAGGTFSAGPHRGGFRVRASLPLAAGTGASAERSATATDARLDPEARDRLRLVRDRQHIDVRRAALVPGVCALVLVGVFVVLQYLTFASVGLTSEGFARVHLGDSVHSAEKVLPGSGLEEEGIPTTIDVPTAPAGSSCRFYLARESVIDFGNDVYRICFSDGAVVAADRLSQKE